MNVITIQVPTTWKKLLATPFKLSSVRPANDRKTNSDPAPYAHDYRCIDHVFPDGDVIATFAIRSNHEGYTARCLAYCNGVEVCNQYVVDNIPSYFEFYWNGSKYKIDLQPLPVYLPLTQLTIQSLKDQLAQCNSFPGTDVCLKINGVYLPLNPEIRIDSISGKIVLYIKDGHVMPLNAVEVSETLKPFAELMAFQYASGEVVDCQVCYDDIVRAKNLVAKIESAELNFKG